MQTQIETLTDKPKKVEIHVFVEFSKTDQRKIEFNTDHVTGSEIKAKAGVPANFDLGRRVQGKIEQVEDNQQIEIKDGEHFVVLPAGTIS